MGLTPHFFVRLGLTEILNRTSVPVEGSQLKLSFRPKSSDLTFTQNP